MNIFCQPSPMMWRRRKNAGPQTILETEDGKAIVDENGNTIAIEGQVDTPGIGAVKNIATNKPIGTW